MKTHNLITNARENARIDYLAKYDTTERKAAFLQAMISTGATIQQNGAYKFATLADYKQARAEWVAAYGDNIGWAEESETRNPGEMAFSRLGGTELNPNTKPKTTEDASTTEEKPLTLRKQLDNAIKANNEPLAMSILARIFAEKV